MLPPPIARQLLKPVAGRNAKIVDADPIRNRSPAPSQNTLQLNAEFPIEGPGGKIDVLADGEARELKRDDSNGVDVFQLFAYLDMTDFKSGYLLAKGFKTSAEAARDHINNSHDVNIT